MAPSIYHNGKQYYNVGGIKAAVLECWQGLDSDLLKRLVSLMHNDRFNKSKETQSRCAQTTQQKGAQPLSRVK